MAAPISRTVLNRRELMAHCYTAAGGDPAAVLACMTGFSPPAQRLIVRTLADFSTLGVTKDAVHAAGDDTFWAFGDFSNVIASFSREPSDPERRVLGIEGIGSAAALKEAVSSGKRTLKLGHLSLKMMNGKVANGEWRWIDEPGCVMHTATPKPAFLRTKLTQQLQLNLQVLRHEKFVDQQVESSGDLIMFDIDKADVRCRTGNQNVWCQNTANYELSLYDGLGEDLRSAVSEMLSLELRPAVHDNLYGGSDEYFLAQVNSAGLAFYQMPAQATGSTEPRFRGTVQEFHAEVGEEIAQQMKNRSLVCAQCGKTNAINMKSCNGCGASLEGAAPRATENVVMGFIYGVERGEKIPYTLSIRGEDSNTIVYDDLLARSPCHINAVPTDVHFSDWRALLVRPEEGCLVLKRLETAALRAVETHFWGNEAFRSSVLRPGAVASAAEYNEHAILALNGVPSQYQLHMHCIMPPFLPENYHKNLAGQRFGHYRWLPLDYLYAALESVKQSGGLLNAPTMETEQIIAHIKANGGPCYEDMYAAALRRYSASHELLANWRPEFFERVAVCMPRQSEEYMICALQQIQHRDSRIWCADVKVDGADHKHLEKSDKQLLQSYGRPYNSNGSPAPTSYYSFARQPSEVMTEKAWLQQTSER